MRVADLGYGHGKVLLAADAYLASLSPTMLQRLGHAAERAHGRLELVTAIAGSAPRPDAHSDWATRHRARSAPASTLREAALNWGFGVLDKTATAATLQMSTSIGDARPRARTAPGCTVDDTRSLTEPPDTTATPGVGVHQVPRDRPVEPRRAPERTPGKHAGPWDPGGSDPTRSPDEGTRRDRRPPSPLPDDARWNHDETHHLRR